MSATKTALVASSPGIFPALYVGTVDMLSDPAKLMGFMAITAQVVYVGIKIYKEIKGNDKEPAN